MLIRTGLGGQLSGSVGGVTASHNRYGQYLRNRTVPVNPNSDRQQEVRQCFAECTIAWRALTRAQQQGWNDYANQTPTLNRLGESVTLTGQAMFVRTNTWLRYMTTAGTAVLNAPTTPGVANMFLDEVVMDVSEGTFAATLSGDNVTNLAIQIGPPVSAGVTFFKSPFRLWTIGEVSAGGIELNGFYAENNILAGQRRPLRATGSDAQGRLTNVITWIQDVVA